MSIVTYDDGIVVDEETGEIIDLPEGAAGDPLQFVALAHRTAKEEAKSWDARAGQLGAVLLKRMEGPRQTWPEVVASVRSSGSRYDMDQVRAFLVEAEVTRDELVGLVLAASGFAEGKVPAALKDAMADFRKAGTTYVLTERVRHRAPRATGREEAET